MIGDDLDLRGEIARIDRDRAETAKLTEETRKFTAEQHKLMSEAAKLDRDRWLAPWLAVITVLGGFAGFLSVAYSVWHAAHGLPP